MTENIRILLVDDNEAIHKSFRKIFLEKTYDTQLKELDRMLFDNEFLGDAQTIHKKNHDIDSAYQGAEALELVEKSLRKNNKYSICFMDIRMPPGIDGIETIKQIWQMDSELPVVIISADFDYSLKEILQHLQNPRKFLILKKPFDIFEIKQMINMFAR